jgi:hypothetical protein
MTLTGNSRDNQAGDEQIWTEAIIDHQRETGHTNSVQRQRLYCYCFASSQKCDTDHGPLV